MALRKARTVALPKHVFVHLVLDLADCSAHLLDTSMGPLHDHQRSMPLRRKPALFPEAWLTLCTQMQAVLQRDLVASSSSLAAASVSLPIVVIVRLAHPAGTRHMSC